MTGLQGFGHHIIKRGVTFEDEPDWMKQARQAPLQSTWESRNPQHTLSEGCYITNTNHKES